MATRVMTLVIGGVLLVLGLAVLVATDRTDAFDRSVIEALRDPDLHDRLAFLGMVTEAGSTGAVIVVAAVVAGTGVLIGPWRHGLLGAATIALASAGVEGVKAAVARERPDLLEPILVEHGFSFPSGHATLSMAAYGILAVLILRSRLPRPVRGTVVIVLAVLVVLVGISRIWLGVHYPTDVIAGWTTGALVVAAFAALTRGVSTEPAAVAVDADPGARRSDRPAPG
jgi:undecaprenyl-diphosphatase